MCDCLNNITQKLPDITSEESSSVTSEDLPELMEITACCSVKYKVLKGPEEFNKVKLFGVYDIRKL